MPSARGGGLLRRGASGVRIPGGGQGGGHRGQPGGPGGLHVVQHDPGDERHPQRLAERLQEAGIPGLLLHLSPDGPPAHAGELPVDKRAREDQRGLRPGQDFRAEIL